jgi:hypothetical protein
VYVFKINPIIEAHKTAIEALKQCQQNDTNNKIDFQHGTEDGSNNDVKHSWFKPQQLARGWQLVQVSERA